MSFENGGDIGKKLERAINEGRQFEQELGLVFPKPNHVEGEDAEALQGLFVNLSKMGIEASESVKQIFQNKDFFNALKHRLGEPFVAELVSNTSKFDHVVVEARKKVWSGDTSGFLGEEVEITGIKNSDGRERRTEKGNKVHIEHLKTLGIDPSRVLIFRRTDLSGESKPERYWTSDYSEVLNGLTVKISGERRNSSIVLVSDLETVEKSGGGLIQDINDDSGMSFCQIKDHPFDRTRTIVILSNPQGFRY